MPKPRCLLSAPRRRPSQMPASTRTRPPRGMTVCWPRGHNPDTVTNAQTRLLVTVACLCLPPFILAALCPRRPLVPVLPPDAGLNALLHQHALPPSAPPRLLRSNPSSICPEPSSSLIPTAVAPGAAHAAWS
ncbi:hypothetical protein SORBI_3004G132150 [Sorghum bicolor]|uniref:Uncharacterized protein n=1 Tax=Sorghum bicolor TaxID=4558 RepID=A0A1Z5RMZ9_SORBI|nr:hypothetical protein SORBI_3004G132150 [Sorghum bicolor]